MENWKPGGTEPHAEKSTIQSIDTSFAIVTALQERDGAGVTELAEKEAGGKAVIDEDLLDEVTANSVPLAGLARSPVLRK